MTPEQRFRLAGWLSDRTGGAVEITAAERMGVGHSKAMWSLTTHHGGRLVARIDQGGVFGTRIADEVRTMTALRDAGVPVPRIVAADPDGHVLGRPLLVMVHVDGADGTRLPPAVVDDLIRRLHELHELREPDEPAPTGHREGRSPADALPGGDQVAHWLGVARRVGRVPLLEEAAARLVATRPAAAVADRPVHGDAGPGNLVHDGERVLALTDWEFAHLGDPAEDWVYLATDRGSAEMSTEAWRRRIAALTGWSITDAEWSYWNALNEFKGACANLTALPVFLGETPAPDLLTVGTALHHVFLRRVVTLVEALPAGGSATH